MASRLNAKEALIETLGQDQDRLGLFDGRDITYAVIDEISYAREGIWRIRGYRFRFSEEEQDLYRIFVRGRGLWLGKTKASYEKLYTPRTGRLEEIAAKPGEIACFWQRIFTVNVGDYGEKIEEAFYRSFVSA